MAKSSGGPDSMGRGEEARGGFDEATKRRIKDSPEYKKLEAIFGDLAHKNRKKQYAGIFDSQAGFVDSLRKDVENFAGSQQEAARLFIANNVAKAKKEIAVVSDEDEEGGKRSKGRKKIKLPRGRQEAVEESETDLGIEPEITTGRGEAPTVEAVEHVIEEALVQAKETGHPITLAEYRHLLMEWFPILAVRTGFKDFKTGEQFSNLDGNACLFLFREVLGFAKGTEAEQDYVFKDVAYVKPGNFKPGALNFDTSSPGIQGIEADDLTLFVDHHGIDSPRESSAFQILYEDFKRVGLDKQLSPEDGQALEKLSQFVTAVDSYVLPKDQNWREVWEKSHVTVFGLTTSYQNNVPLSILFDFFKHHSLAEAFTLPVNKTTEPYLERFKNISEEDGKEKYKTDQFLVDVRKNPSSVGFVVEIPGLGRILVQKQKDFKDKKRGLQMAALAAGYDGILVFDEKDHSVFLAVGEKAEITSDIADKIKADLLVRKSLLKKFPKKDEDLTLSAVLLGLGVSKESLPVGLLREVEKIEDATIPPASDVPPADTSKDVPLPTETNTTGKAPVSPDVISPPPTTSVKPKTETEKSQEFFHGRLLTFLNENNGEVPRALLFNESFLRELMDFWDIFNNACNEYNADKTKSKTVPQRNVVDFIYSKISHDLNLTKDPTFFSWLLKMKFQDPSFPGLVNWAKKQNPQLYKFLREEILGLEPEVEEKLGDVIKLDPTEELLIEGGMFHPGTIVSRTDLPISATNKATIEGFVIKNGERYYKIKENRENIFAEKILGMYIPFPDLPPLNPPPPEMPGSGEHREGLGNEEGSREGSREEEEEPVSEGSYGLERFKKLSEGGENYEVAENRLNSARQDFIFLYKNYLAAKKSTAKVDKLKSKLAFWKKGEKKTVATSAEILDAKVKMETARERYLQAKQEFGRALFKDRVKGLIDEGYSAEGIAYELNSFNAWLFDSLMLNEEIELNKGQAVDWPAKEKNILRQGFDWYVKQHWSVRVLVSTGIITGAVFGGATALGVAMGSTIGAYAATRLLRSGTAAGLGQMFGKIIDQVMSFNIEKYVKTNLREATLEAVESGADPKAVFDEMWARQNKIFEARKKKEKVKLYSKIGVMMATGLGVYGISMALYPNAVQAGEQAAAAAVKEASEHGGAVASAKAVAETPSGTGTGARTAVETKMATPKTGGVVSEKAPIGGLTAEELSQRAQEISEDYGRNQARFLEVAREKMTEAAAQSKLDELATLRQGEGIISVLRRQLEAMPEKFGFTGDTGDTEAVHSWAENQATQLSINEGYWDPTTGKQLWTRWDAFNKPRFNLEGDVENGFKVIEANTGDKQFIHEAGVAAAKSGKSLAGGGEEALRATAKGVAKSAVAGTEQSPEAEGYHPAGTEEWTPPVRELPITEAIHSVGNFPKTVQPFATYLEAKVRAAQELSTQYASDPVMGPASKAAFDQVQKDIATFIDKVDGKDLGAYTKFSPKSISPMEELRGEIARSAGVKIPVAEISPDKILTMAELLKGGRLAIEKTWGLKFETGANGNIMPIIDAPRGEMAKVFEAHAGMETDGWLQDEKLANLALKNVASGGLPQTRLAQIDFLVRALDHLDKAGSGVSPAVKIIKSTIRGMMGNIAETINESPDKVFTKAFIDRVK